MKKLFIFTIIGFGLFSHGLQAEGTLKNSLKLLKLSDLIPKNSDFSQDAWPLQQATTLTQYAKNEEIFQLGDTFYHIHFGLNERRAFNEIMGLFPEACLKHIMQALRDGKLQLDRGGVFFSLSDQLGHRALFFIGTEQQLDDEFEKSKKGEKTALATSALGNLGILPEELILYITGFLRCIDFIHLSQASREIKRVCSDKPTLFRSLNRQFYDAIQALFVIIPSSDADNVQNFEIVAKQIDQETMDFHIKRLMEVLRFLDDYKHFNIEGYQDIILELIEKEQAVWAAGALDALYKKGANFFNNLEGYGIIHIVLGQVLNHMDKGNRIFILWINNLCTHDLSVNKAAELLFHRQSKHSKRNLASCSSMLLSLLLAQPNRFTQTTRERIRFLIETLEPTCSTILIACALEHPGKDLKFLKGFMQHDAAASTCIVQYLTYKNSDPDLIATVLTVVQHFKMECNKAPSYVAYIKREDATPALMEKIITEAQQFQDVNYKTPIYHAYLKRLNIDPKLVTRIIADTHSFRDENHRISIYQAYLRRPTITKELVTMILEDTASFQAHNTLPIYTEYIKRVDADPTTISLILERTNNFHQYYVSQVYKANLSRTSVS